MNIKDMLMSMVAEGATDVMFSAGNPPCLRVQGKVRPFGQQAMTAEIIGHLVNLILNEEQKTKFAIVHELDCSITVPGVGRFRVNLYQQRGTPAVVMRAIGETVPTIEELFLPGVIDRLSRLEEGLVCICGPSGSGKSTTVAAMVDRINSTRESHVITMEQPVEYVHKMKKSLVEQREVGTDTLSYIDGLKGVMRQAPDVVVVGEMSDLETIAAVLKIAETGHLVITTMATRNVPQSIDRLVEIFPSYQLQQVRSQLAWTLRGIVCQQLLPKATGTGMRVACEVMVVNPTIAQFISEGKTHLIPKAMRDGADFGMMTMDESIGRLVDTGAVRAAAAISRMSDPTRARDTQERAVQEANSDEESASRGQLTARQLEKQLYSTQPSVRRAAEKKLKNMQGQGDKDADEILRQFERFYGSNFDENKRGIRS